MRSALISGVAGLTLTPAERDFFRAGRPAGLILFARNLDSHDQIRALVASVHAAVVSADLLVLIDQEGGRVQRLRPPLGRALPPASAYAALYAEDRERAKRAVRGAARLVAEDLKALGINTNCAPVLDLPVEGAHDIIGNRAYGHSVAQISDLGRAVCEGFLAGGMLPVIKHIPGHGRARADSHLALPVVETALDELMATDFATFMALADMPVAMTAHVVFSALDRQAPASTSARVTTQVIRGAIGFGGLLISDDLSMQALSGPMRARAEAVIRAGSDLALHCNGDLDEMVEAASGVPALEGAALSRWRAALARLDEAQAFDIAEAEAGLARALQIATAAAESV